MSTLKSSAENLTLNADGANNDVIIQSNGSTKAIVTAEGKVGIGTTSPSWKLSVKGGRSIFTDTTPYAIGVRDNSTESSNYNFWIGAEAANDTTVPDLLFSNNAGTSRMRITDTGDITRHKYKLHQSSTPGYNVTYDTGISVNGSTNGKCLLVQMTGHTGAGDGTQTALYLVRCGYDGNQTPAGDKLSTGIGITVGKSASNTVTLATPTTALYSIIELAGTIG